MFRHRIWTEFPLQGLSRPCPPISAGFGKRTLDECDTTRHDATPEDIFSISVPLYAFKILLFFLQQREGGMRRLLEIRHEFKWTKAEVRVFGALCPFEPVFGAPSRLDSQLHMMSCAQWDSFVVSSRIRHDAVVLRRCEALLSNDLNESDTQTSTWHGRGSNFFSLSLSVA